MRSLGILVVTCLLLFSGCRTEPVAPAGSGGESGISELVKESVDLRPRGWAVAGRTPSVIPGRIATKAAALLSTPGHIVRPGFSYRSRKHQRGWLPHP